MRYRSSLLAITIAVLLMIAPLTFAQAPAPPPTWKQGQPSEMANSPLAPVPQPPAPKAPGEIPINKIKVPQGFKVELWAHGIHNARVMVWGEKGTLFVSSRTGGQLYAVTDQGGQRTVKVLAKGLNMPNGRKDSGVGRTSRVRPMLTSRAAILALVVCVIALSLAYPLREYVMQKSQIAQLQDERARMEENVAHLQEREETLGDEEYVEREARTRLHFQYPGETAYIVVRPESEAESETDPAEPKEPWFTELWRSVEEADSPGPDDGL